MLPSVGRFQQQHAGTHLTEDLTTGVACLLAREQRKITAEPLLVIQVYTH